MRRGRRQPTIPSGDRPAASVPGRADYLWEALRTLWPEPARIYQSGRPPSGGAEAAEFLVLPSRRRAAALLPRRPRRAAAGALRNYKASASPRRQAQYRALAVAARLGLTDMLPYRRVSVQSAPAGPQADIADIAAYLRAALGRDVVVSLYLSAPRANRKPVLQALTPDGTVLGFVKVGVNPLTRELVRAEAASLAFLATAGLSQVAAPRLISLGQWRGHEVLVQEAVSGSGRARGLAGLRGAMTEVAGLRGINRMRACDSGYWRELRLRLQALGHRAGDLLRALDDLAPAGLSTSLRFGSWHGDWTPWNMTMAGGRALVWDWERFSSGVPVGYDAIHYQLQAAITRGRAAPRAAAEMALAGAAETLAPLGVDARAAWLVARLYLIEIGARYLHDGQAEAGGRLGQVDTWLLPVLTRQTPAGSAG